MAATFQNSSISSNVLTNIKQDIATQSRRERASASGEVKLPLKNSNQVDLSNKPLHHVDSYVANQKTMVQNMFNARNLNEKLNFKNTFYVEERGELANKEQNTIYGHGKVYQQNVVEAELKAEYAMKVWHDQHVNTVNKVKQGFQKTAETVAHRRNEKAKTQQTENAKHEKEVKKLFKKVQTVVGKMVGTIDKDFKENIETERTDDDEEVRDIYAYHIEKNANDKEVTLNNRGKIRSFMGSKSAENQEKIQAEKEAQERMEAEEEAKRRKMERQEEQKISKYMNLKKLSQRWKIYDKSKLKETVRNEIMKEVLKEEERKNFEKLGEMMRKSEVAESPKKTVATPKKEKNLFEPPKAFNSASNKKKKGSKKYKFQPSKVQKFARESQEDFKTRFGFTVMALPKQKAMLDPVQKHKLTREFQEMVVRNGLEKNGRLVVE